jgi:hypothetical protein
MSDLCYPSWQEPVRLAVMEFNPNKLEEKILVALQAIEARRAELQADPAAHPEERLALQDAVNTIKVVQRELGTAFKIG